MNPAASKAPPSWKIMLLVRAQAGVPVSGSYDEASKSVTHVFNQITATFPLWVQRQEVQARWTMTQTKGSPPGTRSASITIDSVAAGAIAGADALPRRATWRKRLRHDQRVLYGYPTAGEATDAANALVDLKQRSGEAYLLINSRRCLNVRRSCLMRQPGGGGDR